MTKISITPIVLCYFSEHIVATRTDITKAVFRIMRATTDTSIQIDSVMRGGLNYPYKHIRSETVDGELSYWLSNKFIFRVDNNHEQAFCLDNRIDWSDYKLDNLYNTMLGKEFKDEEECALFVDIMHRNIAYKDVI